jgi:hypothetical protein
MARPSHTADTARSELVEQVTLLWAEGPVPAMRYRTGLIVINEDGQHYAVAIDLPRCLRVGEHLHIGSRLHTGLEVFSAGYSIAMECQLVVAVGRVGPTAASWLNAVRRGG